MASGPKKIQPLTQPGRRRANLKNWVSWVHLPLKKTSAHLSFPLQEDEHAVGVAVDHPGPPLGPTLYGFDRSLQGFPALHGTINGTYMVSISEPFFKLLKRPQFQFFFKDGVKNLEVRQCYKQVD